MWSQEFDNITHENYQYHYKSADHLKHIDFTIDEVNTIGHDAGTAGTHWYLCIDKDLGNGRTRRFYGIGIHVSQWLTLFKQEMDRARQGLEPTRYMAVRAREHYWVEPTLCSPVIDSSQYKASQEANQNKMVA